MKAFLFFLASSLLLLGQVVQNDPLRDNFIGIPVILCQGMDSVGNNQTFYDNVQVLGGDVLEIPHFKLSNLAWFQNNNYDFKVMPFNPWASMLDVDNPNQPTLWYQHAYLQYYNESHKNIWEAELDIPGTGQQFSRW